MGLELTLTEDDIEDYYYQYIIKPNGGYDLLSPKTKKQYLNKKIKLRSPMFCKNDKFCSICAGKRFYQMGIKNVGLTTGRITNNMLNASMKNFHNAKVRYDEVNINELLI